MSTLSSIKKNLKRKNVWIAKQTEKAKVEVAKKFVADRAQKDPEFAKDILKYIGESLPKELREIAEKTVKETAHGLVLDKTGLSKLSPVIPDGGCEVVDVPKEELANALQSLSEQHAEQIKELSEDIRLNQDAIKSACDHKKSQLKEANLLPNENLGNQSVG